jgi:hypothetical protein
MSDPWVSAPVVANPEGGSVFLPLLLLATAFVGFLGFQAQQQWVEREQVAQALESLETAGQNATKLRASLDAVATQTARLAGEGNPSARVIVDELRKRGVTINPNGSTKAP